MSIGQRLFDRFRPWRAAFAARGTALVAGIRSRLGARPAPPASGRNGLVPYQPPRRRPARGLAAWPWGGIARAAGFGFIALSLLLFVFLADCAFEIPIDGGMRGPDPTASAILVQASNGSELATRGTIRGEMLTADEISDKLKKAIVAIEDRRFYEHGAIDLRGIARALFTDALHGRGKEGASTLTQQLARLMLLSQDRTARRKVQEALIAAWLEHHLTKPQILARYLDLAYFGAGAYGADAAARRYFNKSARDLTLPEAAMIAGLVRAPSQLAPHRNLAAAQARAKLVLRAMAATGAITQAEAKEAIAHPAQLDVAPEPPSGPGYAADTAAADVKALVGDAAVDLTAQTTIDADMQAAAEKAVASRLDGEGAARHATQAALVAIGSDGAILAMVGGRDYDASPFDRATQAQRQPGSLAKLFVYLTALQQGMTPDTRVTDKPVKIGDWEPRNFDERYHGSMPLEEAFARSINTVAVQLGQQVGIPAVIKTAHELGVESVLPDVPSLALGTAEVNLMEMTRAFATVASDQDKVTPFLVRRITSRDKVLFNRPQQYPGDADAPPARVAMRDMLQEVVRAGTGKAAALPFPTGGKTGTTQDFRDAWFVGSAPDITVGVWVGNDDDSAMDGMTGGDLPAKIWHDFVASAEASMNKRKTGASSLADAARATPGEPPVPVRRPTGAIEMPRQLDAAGDAQAHALPMPRAEAAPDVADAGRAGDPAPADSKVDDARTDDSKTTSGEISGDAEVVDTSTLAIDGREIHLQGVAPLTGRPARALARHLRRHEVSCEPAGKMFRCTVEGDDLATTILANGGSEATADAPADLVAAQDEAQASRRGIWRHRR